MRIWICVSARPTFLFVVVSFSSSTSSFTQSPRRGMSLRGWSLIVAMQSFLSYINVVKGKTIHLGRFDWILWL